MELKLKKYKQMKKQLQKFNSKNLTNIKCECNSLVPH
jgi:hypothetical protein